MNTVRERLKDLIETVISNTDRPNAATVADVIVNNWDLLQSEQGYSEQYKGWVAIFKDEKSYCDFLKWQRKGYSEAEVKELLDKQKRLCAEYLEYNHSQHPFVLDQMVSYAPEPQLKSSLK
jgi:hypothetical protein